MILSGLELNLSDRCNLACAFCYTRRNEGRGPDIERTKATIRWFMGASEAPKASISFFGGEPLVEWNDLQRAVEWGDAEFDRPIRWGIVTNMTLLDDSKLGWLVGHKVRISPSIDGDAAAQDTHRHYADGTGTSDAVFSAARRLLAARPGTSCRMTVSPTTVEHLADSVIFLCSEVGFRTVNSILAAGVDWPPEALDEVKRQTHRLTDWWIEQMRAGRHYSLYYLRNMLMGLSARERRRPLCHAGTGRMAVDTGGNIWPCHRFCNLDSRPEWRLGTLETGITNEDLQRRLREYDLAVALKDRCASCPAVLGCHAVCIHESMIAGAGPDEMIRPTPQMCAIWPHYWAEAMRAHAILTAERNRLYYGSYMRRADRRPARRPQKDDRAAKAHGGVDKCSRQPCREKMAAAVAAASAPAVHVSSPEIAICINTYNEGPRVRATCIAFHEHLHAVKHEIIVGADGVTDGCCDNLPDYVRILRSDRQRGCGRTRLAESEAATARAMLWVDAHQAPLEGEVMDMVEMALREQVIVCPTVGKLTYEINGDVWAPIRFGRANYVPDEIGLTPIPRQYRLVPPDLAEISATRMVSVGLCMSRETYIRVGGWNNFRSTHGSQERGMALRAYMAGVPVRVMRSVNIAHEFFDKNNPTRNSGNRPYKRAYGPMAANLWHAYMTVTSPDTFAGYVRPWLMSDPKTARGAQADKDPAALADRALYARYCKRRPDQAFVDLIEEQMGRAKKTDLLPPDPGGAELEPCALRIISAHARGRCLELGTGSAVGTRALLSGASAVVSVDHSARFTTLARRVIGKEERLELLTCGLNAETGFYDLNGLPGAFDVILVDGPPGTVARRNAAGVLLAKLRAGGCILVDDARRDRKQIAAWCERHNLRGAMLPTRRGLMRLERA